MPAATGSKTRQTAPVYAVVATDAFLRGEALGALLDRIIGDADRSLALAEYDGSAASLAAADVLDDVRTLPLLVPRRVVLVREADAFITRCRPLLEEYVARPCPTGVLVLDCQKMPANTRLYKAIQSVGGIIECDPLSFRNIHPWLVQRAREKHGKTLSREAAELLVEQIGMEPGLLDGELAKLALYVGAREGIETADVEALVGRCREEEIWGLLSAMAAGHPGRALELWEQVWETDPAAPARAVAGIAFKVRRLLEARRRQEAGASSMELKKLLMVWDDRQLHAQLSAFTTAQVEWMLCRLLEADVAAKSGGLSVRASIESLIIEACRRRSAAGPGRPGQPRRG